MDSATVANGATQIVNGTVAFHPLMTWNLFLTIILVPAVGWFITNVIKRHITTSDALKQAQHNLLLKSIEKTDALNTANHEAMNQSLSEWCKLSAAEHEQLWKHHFHHEHNDRGKVTYTGAA